MSWFVARTEPRREKTAQRFAEQKGCNVYFPLCREIRTQRIQPLFPSYLFIYNQNDLWRFLYGTIGIVCLIMRSGRPDLMPDKIVDQLRLRESKGVIDLVPPFQKGDKVDLINCPFEGWHGIVSETSSGQRIRILLEMLGQAVPVTVSMSNLIKAA
jgi:transcription antitermination factor NusG